VQARLGAIPGASHFFRGGITAYSLEQKVRHLGVDRAQASAVNCISEAVAVQMARGACALFDADIAVATTGYAEPSVEWNTPQPFAWWAIAHRRTGGTDAGTVDFAITSACVDCPGLERVAVQERVADAALAGLIKYLRQLRGS
jgi:nicotinamide-nucleotide amidase